MRTNYKLSLLVLLAVLFVSCEEHKYADYKVDQPEDLLEFEYLKELPTLLDATSNSSAIIGATMDVNAYVKQGSANAVLVNSNFTELTPIFDMKHGAVVKDDGSIDVAAVEKFVAKAELNGKTVFGSTLCDYTNQNGKYLNKLIAPYYQEGAGSSWEENWIEYLPGGDFNNGQDWNHFGGWTMGGDFGHRGNEGMDGSGCLYFRNPKVQANNWAGQVQLKFDPIPAPKTPEGDVYIFKVDMKSGKQVDLGDFNVQIVNSWASIPLDSKIVTPEWRSYVAEIVILPGDASIGQPGINFSLGFFDTEFWFDNISFARKEMIEIEGVLSERTPKEKKDTLTLAIKDYINKVVPAAPSTKNWVIASNIMDDINPSELRGADGVVQEDQSVFYWQDYLGKDYVRDIAKTVRASSGDVRLFVSDNGLENLDKCRGLVDMIKYWESDGSTKIDGISVVLNPFCNTKQTIQKVTETNIVKMFEMLASSGKLIRLEGLDIVMKNGDTVLSLPLLVDEHIMMTNFYEFILSNYYSIIPSAQQYGISKTTLVDNSNTASGLWDKDFNRKHTYSGFLKGLESAIK